MNKTLLVLAVLIMLNRVANANLFDDFEDGDYTQNPVWLLAETYHWQEVVDSPTDPNNKVIRIHGTREGASAIATILSEPITFRDFCVSYDFYAVEYNFCPEPTLSTQSADYMIRLRFIADNSVFHFITITYVRGEYSWSAYTIYPSNIFNLNTWYKYVGYYDETNNAVIHELYNKETGNLIATAVHSLSDANFDINKSIYSIYLGCQGTAWQYFDNVSLASEPATPPIADADGPYTIYVDDTLTLDASGSTDDHNNIVSYIWDLDDNNSFETDAGSNAVFDVNYAYLQSLGLLVNNAYKIHLKVTDTEGLSDVNNTTLTIIPIPALQVIVDIKPGSCPNPLNVKSSGVLPVAILGTADFDVTTIDPTSIRLAGVSPLRSSFEDVAGPVADSNDCNCTDDGPDGFLDLTLKFKTQDIVEAIGDVNYGDTLTLKLTGVLIGESPIEGNDCIVISGKHKTCNKFDINKDGVVDSQDFAIFAENWMQSSIIED